MSEPVGIHHLAGLGGDGSRKHDEVAFAKCPIEVRETVRRIRQVTSSLGMLSYGDDAHAKNFGESSKRGADRPESNDHHGRVLQLTRTWSGFADLLLCPVSLYLEF